MHPFGCFQNYGTPKSSILIGFPIIFTIHFGGPPLFLEFHPFRILEVTSNRQPATAGSPPPPPLLWGNSPIPVTANAIVTVDPCQRPQFKNSSVVGSSTTHLKEICSPICVISPKIEGWTQKIFELPPNRKCLWENPLPLPRGFEDDDLWYCTVLYKTMLVNIWVFPKIGVPQNGWWK